MRRDAREVVFRILYSELFADSNEQLFVDLCAQAKLNEAEVEFAKDLLEKVRANKPMFDGIIGELADNYQLDRIYSTDKCAMYIGFAEIIFSKDVPYIVAIDEAVALCKKFSTQESVGFVNGIFAEYVKRNKIS